MSLFDKLKEKGISISISFGKGKDTSLLGTLWRWVTNKDKDKED